MALDRNSTYATGCPACGSWRLQIDTYRTATPDPHSKTQRRCLDCGWFENTASHPDCEVCFPVVESAT